MNDEDYTELVSKSLKSGGAIRDNLTAQDTHNLHMASKIAVEAGALMNLTLQSGVGRSKLDLLEIVEVLGGLEFHMEGLRQSLGLSREECLLASAAELASHPHGSSSFAFSTPAKKKAVVA